MLDGIWQQDCFALRMPTPEALENCPLERSDRGLWFAMGIALGLHAVCFAGLWHWPAPLVRPAATASTILTVTMTPTRTIAPAHEAVTARPVPRAAPRLVRAAHRARAVTARPRPQQTASAAVVAQPVKSAVVAAAGAAVVAGPPVMETAPFCLARTKPVYPSAARRRGQQGVVMVTVEVDADGATLSVDLQRSSGYALLDSAALSAVRHWRFTPARHGGQAVRAAVQVPIRFRLAGGGME